MTPSLTPVVLGGLALVLAGPAATLLGRASWPLLVPRAAIVLWQALALAAVLAALGAGLALALGFLFAPRPDLRLLLLQLAVLALTALVAGRLAWIALRVAIGTRSRRRHHRALVDLVADPRRFAPGLRVITGHSPLVYCLPGLRDACVVLSSAALERLRPEELAAVIAHERAHLRARHDLVLEGFVALREAFPRPLRGGLGSGRGAGVANAPLLQSQLLVELLADDAGRRRVGAEPLARALVALSTATGPDDDGAAGARGGLATLPTTARDTDTMRRVERLTRPARPHRLLGALTYLLAAALVVVPTVAVAVPWLSRVVAALH